MLQLGALNLACNRRNGEEIGANNRSLPFAVAQRIVVLRTLGLSAARLDRSLRSRFCAGLAADCFHHCG
jgi:hypothetical protein